MLKRILNNPAVCGLLLLTGCLPPTYSSAGAKEVTVSDPYKTNFEKAVHSSGEQYIHARDALIQDTTTTYRLQAMAKEKTTWQEEWVTRIVLGWKENGDDREKLEQCISGDLPGSVPITGTFDQKARANTIVKTIGEQSVPFLVENMWKLQNYEDDVRLATVALTLEKLAVPESEIPLVYLLDAPGEEHYRSAAIGILGAMKSWKAFPHIQRILFNKKESELPRSAALGAFIAYDSKDKIETLQRLVTDIQENDHLRTMAAHQLAWENTTALQPFFHTVIKVEENYPDKILVEAVNYLKRQGDQSSIAILETLSDKRKTPELQKAIDKALQRFRGKKEK